MHNMQLARQEFHRPRNPDDQVVPGVPFGRPEWVPSPAYWMALAEQEGDEADAYISPPGTPLSHDVAFCVLGGYGIKMELNRAAFRHLEKHGIFRKNFDADPEAIERLLRQPLLVEGRKVRYRFPRQRAFRLAEALRQIREISESTIDAAQLRDFLMSIPGIGPKTASWIVRNWCGSNDVAILDVHVMRAGKLIGLFPQDARLPRDYSALEKRFLAFAEALNVPASVLDAIIWREMRALTR